MKHFGLLAALFIAHIVMAQPADTLPDAFNEQFSGHTYFDENLGQIANSAGSLVPQVLYESNGSSPEIFAWDDSKVSFQFNFPIDPSTFTGASI